MTVQKMKKSKGGDPLGLCLAPRFPKTHSTSARGNLQTLKGFGGRASLD